ncbi:hypothetical protein WN943_025385 [Citrus x changshan-huyou]
MPDIDRSRHCSIDSREVNGRQLIDAIARSQAIASPQCANAICCKSTTTIACFTGNCD